MTGSSERRGGENPSEYRSWDPREALRCLLEGNCRFVENRSEYPRTDSARRARLRKGQRPMAAVVGCADSRVPAELIFDQGLGDVFSVRVAGNVAAPVVVGSIEYAVTTLGVRLVAVLGHEACGAVQAVVEGAEVTGSLEVIVSEIRPVVTSAREKGGADLLETAVLANTIRAAGALVLRSETLRSRVTSGSVLVVPLLYRLESGRVEELHSPR